MAPHSSTLAWKIPSTEEPGRLQSMGSLRVGHIEDLKNKAPVKYSLDEDYVLQAYPAPSVVMYGCECWTIK